MNPTPAPQLSEQVVLVTGAARDLGRRIAEAFLREGAKVVVNYHSSATAAEELAASHPARAVAVQADVRDRAQVDELLTQAAAVFDAPVSTVVNSALVDFSFDGDTRPKAGEISFDRFSGQCEGAVGGALNVVQAVLADFGHVGSGRVINIGTQPLPPPGGALPRLHRRQGGIAAGTPLGSVTTPENLPTPCCSSPPPGPAPSPVRTWWWMADWCSTDRGTTHQL